MVDEPGGAAHATPSDAAATPSDDAAAKAARKEAKRQAKAAKREAKAAKRAAKAQQAAEKDAAKRARAAEKAAAKADAKAAKAAQKTDAKAAKAARKAAKAERRAATEVERSTDALIGAGELEALGDAEVKPTTPKRAKPAVKAPDVNAPADAPSDPVPGSATGSLAEAAALVRQTREPAASRIVDRVDARPPRVRRPAAIPATPPEAPAPEPATPEPEIPPEVESPPDSAEPAASEADAPTEIAEAPEVGSEAVADPPPVEVSPLETVAVRPEPGEPEAGSEPEAETWREAPGPVEAAPEPASAVQAALESGPEVTSPIAEPPVSDAIQPEAQAPAEPATETPAPEPAAAETPAPEAPEPDAPGAEADEAPTPELADVEAEPEVAAPSTSELEPVAVEPAPEPEAVAPEAIEPEAIDAEAFVAAAVVGEAASAEPGEPASVEPASVEPEAGEPETAEPASVEPELAEPQAAEPVGDEPELAEPELAEPEAASAEPEAAEPEAAEPEADPGQPDIDLVVPASAEPEPAGPHAIDAASVADGAVIGASIDIGANSVHLLVAAVAGHRIEPLLDESVFLGLGDRVARDGRLGPEARQDVVNALASYAATASRLGARALTIVGTEPIRRAFDASALVGEAESRADIALHVLDHDEEAMLTLLGVTRGRRVRNEVLIVDIGGGSCEFVIAGPDRPVRSVGLSLGSARLTQDHIHSDPPTPAEVDALREIARAALIDAPDASPQEMIAVGGTASNLLRLLPATAIDRVLTRRRIAVALAMLTVERSVEAAERHALRPQRARILPAGAVIVDAILERYGVDRLQVSEEGIREGAVLAAASAGPAWRDRLPFLVAGWDEHAAPD